MKQRGNPTQAEDGPVIQRILQGDSSAYRQLVEKYQHRIVNLIACITGNRDDAEDIAQKVFIKVYYSLPRFDLSLPFFPWLYRVTVNQCYDELRRARRQRRQTSLSDLEWGGSVVAMDSLRRPDSQMERQVASELVQRLLLALPRSYREILILKDLTEHSYEEIAEILGCSLQAVRLKVFRARRMLREKIGNLMKEERHLLSSY